MITDSSLTTTEFVSGLAGVTGESVFERFAWFYAFCRERLFRDDTEQIIRSLWPGSGPREGECLLEIGCGPGFYATRLANRFPALEVMGLDRCARLLEHARGRARSLALGNCRFERDDVHALARPDESADAAVLSRLLMMLEDRPRALREVYRVLRPGAACFIAEPRSRLRAALPLGAMWTMAYCLRLAGGPCPDNYGEPRWPAVLSAAHFASLVNRQPWEQVRCWSERSYYYALCRK